MNSSKAKQKDRHSILENLIVFPALHVFTVSEIDELFSKEDSNYKSPHNLKLVSR